MQGLEFAELGLKLGMSRCCLAKHAGPCFIILADGVDSGIRNFLVRAVKMANKECDILCESLTLHPCRHVLHCRLAKGLVDHLGSNTPGAAQARSAGTGYRVVVHACGAFLFACRQ